MVQKKLTKLNASIGFMAKESKESILKTNWWKIICIVLTALVVRVLLLQILPLRSSSTFELPLSILSQKIGMMPTAAIIITFSYTVIAVVLMMIQEGLSGNKLERMILCSLPFSLIWLMAVLESVSSLGKPFLPELFIGLSDIVPVLMIGIIISFWFSKDTTKQKKVAHRPKVVSIFVIAFTYFVGRYFLYTLVHINSGYFSQTNATFLWTLAIGLSIGAAYYMFYGGIKGSSPFHRGLWFGCIVFGLYWALNNFFMPIVFDMSFIQFDPPILNYVYRIIGDASFVSLGAWIAEKAGKSLIMNTTKAA